MREQKLDKNQERSPVILSESPGAVEGALWLPGSTIRADPNSQQHNQRQRKSKSDSHHDRIVACGLGQVKWISLLLDYGGYFISFSSGSDLKNSTRSLFS